MQPHIEKLEDSLRAMKLKSHRLQILGVPAPRLDAHIKETKKTLAYLTTRKPTT